MTYSIDKKIRINVPYFQQTRFSTCGPAALMMVMKYWDKKFELTRKNEFIIWIKSNPLIFLGGTLQFGLTRTAQKKGYKVQIYQKSKFSTLYPNKKKFIDIYEKIASYGARHNNIKIKYSKNIIDEIFKSVEEKIPPIVFINLKPLIGENVLHWIVVTGYERDVVFVNDPYVPIGSKLENKKDYPIKLIDFKNAVNTDNKNGISLPPCFIKISK